MFTISEPFMFTASVQYKLYGAFDYNCHELAKMLIDHVTGKPVEDTCILGVFNVLHKYVPEDVSPAIKSHILLQLTGKGKSKKYKKQSHLLVLEDIVVRKFSNGTNIYINQSNKMYKILMSVSKSKTECIIGIPGTLCEDYADANKIVNHMQSIFANMGIESKISAPNCTLKNYKSTIDPGFTDKETLKQLILDNGLGSYNVSNMESNKELVITITLDNGTSRKIRIYNKSIIFYSYQGDVVRDIIKQFHSLFEKHVVVVKKNIVIDFIGAESTTPAIQCYDDDDEYVDDDDY